MHRLRELLLWAGAALGLLAIAAGLAVTFLGFSFLVFRSGSMSPEIPTGGIALSRTVGAADIKSGDVVSVTASNGERITHRVVSTTLRGDEATLVLKGDANATPDSELYVVTSVERVVASLPYGGYVVAHALTPPGLVALACLSLVLLLLSGSRDHESDDEQSSDEPGSGPDGPDDGAGGGADIRPRGGRHLAAPRRTPLLRTAAVIGAAAVTVVAVTGTASTLAAFTDKPTTTTTSTANKFFTCDAAARGLAGSPYLYWKLNESLQVSGVNTAADSSGNNRTGTYQGTLALAGQPRACGRDTGTAVSLNGSSGYISTTSNNAIAGPNTFALSMWFKTTTNRGGKLIGFGNARTEQSGKYDRHIYMTNDGRLVFGVYPGGVRVVTSPDDYDDGRWHHVVASLSSAGMKLYVDGALVASRTDTTTGENYSGFWRVGYDNLNAWENVPSSQYFNGIVDEVAVYTAAPTDADVMAAYRAGLPTP